MCCMFFVCLFVLSFYFSKHQLIVSIIMVMGALNWEEVTTKRRPERLIEPNIQYFFVGGQKGSIFKGLESRLFWKLGWESENNGKK